MNQEIGVGVLGYGFMGRTHTYGYKSLAFYLPDPKVRPRLRAVYGRNEKNVKAAAQSYGYDRYYTDWRELIEDDQVDVVDNCLPNFLHFEPTLAVLEAGKNVVCEKPLAVTLKQARTLAEKAQSAPGKNMVMFNYRFIPAITLASKMIQQDAIGEILEFRGLFAHLGHLDPNRKFSWKEDLSLSGGGAIADLGIHVIDLARFLVGNVRRVCASARTFFKQRRDEAGAMRKVTVDDASIMLLEFENEAVGSLEATRVAGGLKNALRIMIHGTEGSLAWDLEHLNFLQYFSRKDAPQVQGWKQILVDMPWWPPRGHIVGWPIGHLYALHNFLVAVREDREASPSFREGYEAQRILEASLLSVREARWISPPE